MTPTKKVNNESNMISGRDLQIYAIPIIRVPTSIIIHSKKGAFITGSIKG